MANGLRIGTPYRGGYRTLLWRCSCGQEHTGHWHYRPAGEANEEIFPGHKPLVNIRGWLPLGTKVEVTCGHAKGRIFPVAGYMDDPLDTDVLLDDGDTRNDGTPWLSRCSIFNLRPIRRAVA